MELVTVAPTYVQKLVSLGQLTERQAERWRADCRRTGDDPEAFRLGLADWVRPWTPAEWEAWLRDWRQQPHTIRQATGPAVRFAKRERALAFPPAVIPSRVRQKILGAINGYRGAVEGLENGRDNLGRKPVATADQRKEIERLYERDLSLRMIALRVFGDVRYKDRVRRHLRRCVE
jgi:hypothetical protein